MYQVLDLTDQVASTSLFGPIGVGKSFVAHTLLQHNRTETKFGTNRHFVRCDDLTSSLEDFLERLADVINMAVKVHIKEITSHGREVARTYPPSRRTHLSLVTRTP